MDVDTHTFTYSSGKNRFRNECGSPSRGGSRASSRAESSLGGRDSPRYVPTYKPEKGRAAAGEDVVDGRTSYAAATEGLTPKKRSRDTSELHHKKRDISDVKQRKAVPEERVIHCPAPPAIRDGGASPSVGEEPSRTSAASNPTTSSRARRIRTSSEVVDMRTSLNARSPLTDSRVWGSSSRGARTYRDSIVMPSRESALEQNPARMAAEIGALPATALPLTDHDHPRARHQRRNNARRSQQFIHQRLTGGRMTDGWGWRSQDESAACNDGFWRAAARQEERERVYGNTDKQQSGPPEESDQPRERSVSRTSSVGSGRSRSQSRQRLQRRQYNDTSPSYTDRFEDDEDMARSVTDPPTPRSIVSEMSYRDDDTESVTSTGSRPRRSRPTAAARAAAAAAARANREADEATYRSSGNRRRDQHNKNNNSQPPSVVDQDEIQENISGDDDEGRREEEEDDHDEVDGADIHRGEIGETTLEPPTPYHKVSGGKGTAPHGLEEEEDIHVEQEERINDQKAADVSGEDIPQSATDDVDYYRQSLSLVCVTPSKAATTEAQQTPEEPVEETIPTEGQSEGPPSPQQRKAAPPPARSGRGGGGSEGGGGLRRHQYAAPVSSDEETSHHGGGVLDDDDMDDEPMSFSAETEETRYLRQYNSMYGKLGRDRKTSARSYQRRRAPASEVLEIKEEDAFEKQWRRLRDKYDQRVAVETDSKRRRRPGSRIDDGNTSTPTTPSKATPPRPSREERRSPSPPPQPREVSPPPANLPSPSRNPPPAPSPTHTVETALEESPPKHQDKPEHRFVLQDRVESPPQDISSRYQREITPEVVEQPEPEAPPVVVAYRPEPPSYTTTTVDYEHRGLAPARRVPLGGRIQSSIQHDRYEATDSRLSRPETDHTATTPGKQHTYQFTQYHTPLDLDAGMRITHQQPITTVPVRTTRRMPVVEDGVVEGDREVAERWRSWKSRTSEVYISPVRQQQHTTHTTQPPETWGGQGSGFAAARSLYDDPTDLPPIDTTYTTRGAPNASLRTRRF